MPGRQEYTKKEVFKTLKGMKKGAKWPLAILCNELELVNQTQRYDVISTDARLTGELVFINQVDFVINVGRHVFVK